MPAEPEETKKSDTEKPKLRGKTTIRKRGTWSKVKDLFAEDGVGYGTHLLENVVVPMMKDIGLRVVQEIGFGIYDSIQNAMHPRGSNLHDVRATYPTRGPGPIGHTPYGGYHATSRPPMGNVRPAAPTMQPYYKPQGRRPSNRLQDVIFEYRSDAQQALAYLEGLIEEDGFATLAQFYEFVAYPLTQTDVNYGWSDVSRAYVQEIGKGKYILNLPEPEPIRG